MAHAKNRHSKPKTMSTRKIRTNMLNLLLLNFGVLWVALCVQNPYIIATLFSQVLILATIVLGSESKFIALMMFLVYAGGIMILIRYCLILIPINKFRFNPAILIPFLITITLPIFRNNIGTYSYGLLYSGRVILLLSLLLYLVMTAVVGIIDYSNGIIKT